jgi:SAM-dependent methyltransferase
MRVPEPMVMDEPRAAVAFHQAGDHGGPLAAQYELCARGMSRLLRRDGIVMDLGSGSGRYLSYFAQRRADACIVGLELSDPMLTLGERMLADEHLHDRVRLMRGDMTDCAHLAPECVDLLSCMLALHQLPSEAMLVLALQQIAAIRERTGCAVWIWDLARLKDHAAMQEWLEGTGAQDPRFLRDALASEAASWTLIELMDALEDAGLPRLSHCSSRPPLLQAHWAPQRSAGASADEEWRERPLPPEIVSRIAALRDGFDGLPGQATEAKSAV